MSDFISQVQSLFGQNILGTLFTALFGALIGSWIASRRETKRSVMTELSNLNAAHIMCFSICNKFLSLKKQHIYDLHRKYHAKREELMSASSKGTASIPIGVFMDFRTLTPIWIPTPTLQTLVFEKISVRSAKTLAAAIDLVSAIDALEKSIHYRNELIDDIRKQTLDQQQLLNLYLGLRSKNVYDERFGHNIDALSLQVDDCIMFSRILADGLCEYGENRRKQFSWRYRLGSPKIKKMDWTIAMNEGLMPPEEAYAYWLRGFRPYPTRIERLRNWLRSIIPSWIESKSRS